VDVAKPHDVRSALIFAGRMLNGHDQAKYLGQDHSPHDSDWALDARVLLADALDCTPLDLIVDPARPLSAERLHVFVAALTRRNSGEPVARIIGQRHFYGRSFRLSPATLEPRPDSECLIDTALDLLRNSPVGNNRARILDIGTGSGCLLLSLLAELPTASGVGTDVSAEALIAARANAEALGLADRASFAHGSCSAGALGHFDLIISNPPYIRTDDLCNLDAEVRDWDPRAALDGGGDGLDVYRAILSDTHIIYSNTYVVFETSWDQAKEVASLAENALFEFGAPKARIVADMAGRQRCVALSTHI
jgi:release factor glutamine methyltransferase